MNGCPNCAASLMTGATFCGTCGQRLARPQDALSVQPLPRKSARGRSQLMLAALFSIAAAVGAIWSLTTREPSAAPTTSGPPPGQIGRRPTDAVSAALIRVTGRVVDEHGAAIPRTEVGVYQRSQAVSDTNPNLGLLLSACTDAAGRFSLDLPAGNYQFQYRPPAETDYFPILHHHTVPAMEISMTLTRRPNTLRKSSCAL